MLHVTRTITRELPCNVPAGRPGPIVLQLQPGSRALRIKRKGDRKWYTVPFDAIWRLGSKIEGERIRAAKAVAREERRVQRRR